MYGVYGQLQSKYNNWIYLLGGRQDWVQSQYRNRASAARPGSAAVAGTDLDGWDHRFSWQTASVVLLGQWFGAEHMMLMTLAPKSVTSPIAMLVAEQIGGVAALAAVFVLITGVIGAIAGPGLLRLLRVHSPEARGMALGMTAHAVGTSVALQEGEECGAFAALAMSLMGVATAVFLPLAVSFIA